MLAGHGFLRVRAGRGRAQGDWSERRISSVPKQQSSSMQFGLKRLPSVVSWGLEASAFHTASLTESA